MSLPLSEIVRRAAAGEGRLPRPLQATINVTTRCNSRCAYCAFGDPAYPHAPDPSFDTLATLVHRLGRFGVRSLSISGGEPLLRPDLADIIGAAAAAGLAVTLVTNGILLTVERADQLAAAGLKTLVLSLDTLEAQLYHRLRGVGAARPVTAFRELQAHRRGHGSIPRVVVNAVLTRANYDRLLAHFEALLEDLLLQDTLMVQAYQPPPNPGPADAPLRFRPEDLEALEALCAELAARQRAGWPIGNAPEFLARLPAFLAEGRLPAHYECLTAYSSLYIKETLDVHPCWQFSSAGNLADTSVEELWVSPAFEQARLRMKRLDCRKCALVCHAPDFMDTLADFLQYEPFPKQ